VDAPLVLDVGHHVRDHVHGDGLPVVVGEGVDSHAVVGEVGGVCVEGDHRAVNSRVREGPATDVGEDVGLVLQDVDNLVVDARLVLDVGHHVRDHVHGDEIGRASGRGRESTAVGGEGGGV